MDVAKAYDMEERTVLFTTLADRLLNVTQSAASPERTHLLRLLSSLLQTTDKTARRIFVEQMVQQAAPPKDLAMLLAQDDAEIAAPILRQVPFTQKELIELVTRTGPEHHIEIAKRADLTLDVWLTLARAAARRVHKKKSPSDKKPEDTIQIKAERPSQPSGLNHPLTKNEAMQKSSPSPPCGTESVPMHAGYPGIGPSAAPSNTHPLTQTARHSTDFAKDGPIPLADAQPDQNAQPPLEDSSATSWQFETTRNGRIYRLSPNAKMAFGSDIHNLVGEYFAPALQARAAGPCADDVAEAMNRRVPLRDIIVETMTMTGQTHRWALRGRPRFSFPDGRFEGYSGTAQDLDARREKGLNHQRTEDLLYRMARAADRLAEETSSPELEEYARTMRDCVEALMTMPVSFRNDNLAKSTYDPD